MAPQRRSTSKAAPENPQFPQLSGLGLTLSDIRGDGNCLFRALSDQLFGNQKHHHSIRTRVVNYMRQHPEDFKSFIVIQGGERRNPKRKTTVASAGPIYTTTASDEQSEEVWRSYLDNMAVKTIWASQLEITAFTKEFATNVKIYHEDGNVVYTATTTSESADPPCAYIAFHSWKHYSSVRNVDGPFTGLPNVQPRDMPPEEEARVRILSGAGDAEQRKIQRIKTQLPEHIDEGKIKQALVNCNGNPDEAYMTLAQEVMDASSGRASVERDSEDDDDVVGPNKRHQRIKAAKPQKQVSGSTTGDDNGKVDGIKLDSSPPDATSSQSLIGTKFTSPASTSRRNLFPPKKINRSQSVGPESTPPSKSRRCNSLPPESIPPLSEMTESQPSTRTRRPFPKIILRITKASQKQNGSQGTTHKAGKKSKRTKAKHQGDASSTDHKVKSKPDNVSNKLATSRTTAKRRDSATEVTDFKGINLEL